MAKAAKPVEQKRRADAQRNRQRLLEAAKNVFAQKGISSSMDEIARSAKVGAGTLYRHFPTRDALVTAVYRNETDQLVAGAAALTARHPPVMALRKWLLQFVDYVATKHGMFPLLDSLAGGPTQLYSAAMGAIRQALSDLLERAEASGDVLVRVEAMALIRALAGVAKENQDEAKRLVDVLMKGMQHDKHHR